MSRQLTDSQLSQSPPLKGARKRVPREECRKDFWHFLWRFLTFFGLGEKCHKVSRMILTLFDDFWRFLTWPLSAGPFCSPLIFGDFNGFPPDSRRLSIHFDQFLYHCRSVSVIFNQFISINFNQFQSVRLGPNPDPPTLAFLKKKRKPRKKQGFSSSRNP